MFLMYPKEVEILIERIRARREQEEDAEYLRMITAASAPHSKDGGKAIINQIMAKYKSIAMEDVTAESIRQELAIARSILQR